MIRRLCVAFAKILFIALQPSAQQQSLDAFFARFTADWLGALKILELREKARQALGDRFSERDYHTAVLRTGTVPLDILEQQIDPYIQSAR